MPWQPSFNALRDALADLYPTEADARRIVASVGLDNRRIAFHPQAINTWQSILEEAGKQGQVEAIVEAALAEYPRNRALLAAREGFSGPPADRVASLSASLPLAAVQPTHQEAPMAAEPITLFYSYAHEDETLRDKLNTHLKLLQRQGAISGWHDRMIGAGKEWEGEIDRHLRGAGIILLLVSADFLASDYIWDVELKTAMARHQAGGARVIPVILRACDWHSAPFGVLQALPTDGKAVTSWRNQDEAFTDIARGIRQAAEALRNP